MKSLKRISGFVLCCLLVLEIFANTSATAATPAEIEAAITAGINWLAAQQDVNGYWEDDSSGNKGGTTGLAVLKLEDRAYELGYSSPFDPVYPYSQNVEDGLAYLFSEANSISISNQPAGDPDTDGDGIGVYVDSGDWARTYETGIAMMAIAASRTPNRIVNSPGSPVNGWTYKQVLQDMVDYLAFGQVDNDPNDPNGRGGWDYTDDDPNGPAMWSDNSNSGYAVLGLAYAEAALYGFNCVIPAFVKSELNIWIDYIQNDVDGDPCDGGSGYNTPNDWVNVLKTGNLIFEMTFFGDSPAVQRVQDALDYLGRTWNDPTRDPGWKGDPCEPNRPHYQAMYCIMKGLEYAGIDTIDVNGSPTDWYAEFADAIVSNQDVNGSWPQDEWGGKELATDWALLTLEKTAPPEPKPPVPHLKWSQPPIEMDPTADTPTYWGWDEISYNKDYNDPCGPWKIVADDFRCLGSMPVASIHWWGSHYGWEDASQLPAASDLPEAWQIGFWSNSLCSVAGGKTDVLFLTDTTGSMAGHIANFKTALGGILTAINISLPGADIEYGVADYRNYNDGGNYQTYGMNLIQSFTSDTNAVQAAINSMAAGGGDDTAESHLKGMVTISTNWLTDVNVPDVGFGGRAGAQKILIWAGDAHGHIAGDEPGSSGSPPPGYYPALNTTINALTAQNLLVFALNTVDCSGGINMPYGGLYGQTALKQQADEITSATGGTLFCSVGTGGPSIEDAIVGSITGAVGYSCPEQLLWQINVDANRVIVNQVGTDYFCTYYPNDVSYQYYLDLEPNEYFWQDDFEPNTVDNIFWLSIAAVYPDACEPPVYPWGWKTRPWSWMDDAVTFNTYDPCTMPEPCSITPIEDPCLHESYDVAFELDTDPNYIKWEQPFTGIRDWPHYEDELSMATHVTVKKWEQSPDPCWSGLHCHDSNIGGVYSWITLADDWLCDGGPVTDLHWWGSYEDRGSGIDHFHLSIHEPNVQDPCLPGLEVWGVDVPFASLTEVDTGLLAQGGPTIYLYEYDLDVPFPQIQGESYWFDITAYSVDSSNPAVWYWQEAGRNPIPILYPAVSGGGPGVGWWTPLDWGYGYSDMAFAVTSEEEVNEPNIIRLVADDWRCDGNTPVTALAFWGSYIGYEYKAGHEGPWMDLPVKPDYFRLNIWTDVPAADNAKWSQMPDMDLGVDQYSVHVGDAVCSNDYLCTDPCAVLAVRWWGSYLDGTDPGPGPNIKTFELAFHYDVPAGMQDPESGEILPYSHPFDSPIYHPDVNATEVYYGTTTGGEKVYEYYATLPEPFDQNYWRYQDGDPNYSWPNPVPGSGIFWVDIGYVDVCDPPVVQWGWHESVSVQIDNAISNPGWHFPPWAAVTVLDKDLAFEIITTGEGPSYSHPNEVIWEYDAYDYDEVLVGFDKHPHDSCDLGREPVFRYSVRLPDPNWFLQEDVNNIYWLSVVAVYDQIIPNYDWGWTNHKHEFNDDAVAGTWDDANSIWIWEELFDQTETSEDMSFILFTEPECMASTNPDYANWVLNGKPDCWCYSKHCRGDTDNSTLGSPFWVNNTDKSTFVPNWNLFPDFIPPMGAFAGDTCADFTHAYVGPFWVDNADKSILVLYWNLWPNFVPPFGPPDCSGPGCNAGAAGDPHTCDTNALPNTEYNYWMN